MFGRRVVDRSSVPGMDWVQDMTARWIRILGATDDVTTPVDRAVQQISALGETSGLGRKQRKAAEASAATALSRQLVAGVIVSDLMIGRLCLISGQTREQVLDQMSGDLPRQMQDQQLRALQAELSRGWESPRDEGPTYAGLGARVEQLLKLAENQATALVEQARAEAAEIRASAGTPQACPKCGSQTCA
jgi:hypothetical protein